MLTPPNRPPSNPFSFFAIEDTRSHGRSSSRLTREQELDSPLMHKTQVVAQDGVQMLTHSIANSVPAPPSYRALGQQARQERRRLAQDSTPAAATPAADSLSRGSTSMADKPPSRRALGQRARQEQERQGTPAPPRPSGMCTFMFGMQYTLLTFIH